MKRVEKKLDKLSGEIRSLREHMDLRFDRFEQQLGISDNCLKSQLTKAKFTIVLSTASLLGSLIIVTHFIKHG